VVRGVGTGGRVVEGVVGAGREAGSSKSGWRVAAKGAPLGFRWVGGCLGHRAVMLLK
jgi:hypothetical protein